MVVELTVGDDLLAYAIMAFGLDEIRKLGEKAPYDVEAAEIARRVLEAVEELGESSCGA